VYTGVHARVVRVTIGSPGSISREKTEKRGRCKEEEKKKKKG
jgi:hypothetical protein